MPPIHTTNPMNKDNLEDNYQDICPVNDSGRHRYFIFKTYVDYELVADTVRMRTDFQNAVPESLIHTALYDKVEYAISGCNCGSATRQRVKQA